MKELKQRFSKWFNKEPNRFGTLWAERFKSVRVEDQPGVVQTVAAYVDLYVDLNPVRAGLGLPQDAATSDADFRVYRRHGRQVIPTLSP